jgi:outer membrane protein assembly factor BamB
VAVHPPSFGGDDDLSAIAVDNAGHIYIGSDASRVFALQPDGSQLWAPFIAGGNVESPMAVSESPARIYFGIGAGSNSALFAVNKATGSPIWSFGLSPNLGEIPGGVTLDAAADPVDLQGTIYFGTDIEPVLFAVKTGNGARWKYPSSTSSRRHSHPRRS